MNKIYVIELNKDIKTNDLLLPSNIEKECSKYKNEEHYFQSKAAWKSLTNILLNDYSINLCEKEIKHINGKPYIDDIFFNISHSGNVIVIGISEEECGVDIQIVNSERKTKTTFSQISKTLSEEEVKEYSKLIEIDEDSAYDFYIRNWTKKEAYFKADNKGIILSQIKYINTKMVKTFEYYDKDKNKYYISCFPEMQIINKDHSLK